MCFLMILWGWSPSFSFSCWAALCQRSLIYSVVKQSTEKSPECPLHDFLHDEFRTVQSEWWFQSLPNMLVGCHYGRSSPQRGFNTRNIQSQPPTIVIWWFWLVLVSSSYPRVTIPFMGGAKNSKSPAKCSWLGGGNMCVCIVDNSRKWTKITERYTSSRSKHQWANGTSRFDPELLNLIEKMIRNWIMKCSLYYTTLLINTV